MYHKGDYWPIVFLFYTIEKGIRAKFFKMIVLFTQKYNFLSTFFAVVSIVKIFSKIIKGELK